MKQYENPKINIQLFDIRNTVTMSGEALNNLVPGLKSESLKAVTQVTYDDIIAYTTANNS